LSVTLIAVSGTASGLMKRRRRRERWPGAIVEGTKAFCAPRRASVARLLTVASVFVTPSAVVIAFAGMVF